MEGFIGPRRADSENDEYQVPLSNEITLAGHSKVVSALALDPSGSRLLTGSYDYTVHMYDFQGMDASLEFFREVVPFDGHQVRGLSWSPSGDRFMAVTGSSQLKIFDRDGRKVGESIRGDMYIRDVKQTKGHITGLTCGKWNPVQKNRGLTSSEDGSLRVWNFETDLKSQEQVIKPKLSKPGRVSVTTCAWTCEGNSAGGGLADGSIQVWDVRASSYKPRLHIGRAHGEGVTAIAFSRDGCTLVSRSTDCTLKVWDMRAKGKDALATFSELPCHYAETGVEYSPDEKLILTGTSRGQLVFVDMLKLQVVPPSSQATAEASDESVVCCQWHPRINQILTTSGNRTRVLYDPHLSFRGALLCTGHRSKGKRDYYCDAQPVIRNPHALPMFRQEPSRKRQREKARNDPVKSMRPEMPLTGPGHGGRIGSSNGSLLAQHLFAKETWRDEDPQQAILKYAGIAAADPKYISPAYAQTQPHPIFDESEDVQEE